MPTSREFLNQQLGKPSLPNAPTVGMTTEEQFLPSPAPAPTDWTRFGLEVGGSVLGSMVAPEVALPAQVIRMLGPAVAKGLPTLMSKMAGSGGGAGAGSLAAEPFSPTKTPYEQTGDPSQFGVPASPLKSAEEAAKLGAFGEGVGRTVGQGVKSFFTPTLEPGALQAQRLLGKKGASLTMGQATKTPSLQFLENVSEAGFVETKTGRTKAKGELAANEILEDIVKQYESRGGSAALGTEVKDALRLQLEQWKEGGHQKYRELDALLQATPIRVDIRPVQMRAQQLAAEMQLKDPKAAGLLKQILTKPSQMPFTEAQQLRSQLLSVGGDPSELVKGRQQSYAKLLSDLVDTQMETAGKATKVNAPAYQKWREASAYWKGTEGGLGRGLLDDPVITQILDKDPGVVLDSLLQKGKTEGFGAALTLLPPQVVNGVRREFLDRALSASKVEAPGSIVGKRSGAKLAGELGLDDPYSKESAAFQALFGKQAGAEIGEAVHTLRLTQNTPADRGFTFVVRGAQIGAMGSALAMESMAPLIILATPSALGQILQNPVTRKLFLRAQSLEPQSHSWVATMGKLLTFADKNGIPVSGGRPGLEQYSSFARHVAKQPMLQLPRVPEFRQTPLPPPPQR